MPISCARRYRVLCIRCSLDLRCGKSFRAIAARSRRRSMEREGALITHYPLLIQKTLADKLSDKIQVIIRPTPTAGKFIGSNLIGGGGQGFGGPGSGADTSQAG